MPICPFRMDRKRNLDFPCAENECALWVSDAPSIGNPTCAFKLIATELLKIDLELRLSKESPE